MQPTPHDWLSIRRISSNLSRRLTNFPRVLRQSNTANQKPKTQKPLTSATHHDPRVHLASISFLPPSPSYDSVMSGFEIVGVVFAVLPLFTKAGELYAQSPLHKAVLTAPRDEKLADFYTYFWWEIYELESHLDTLIDKLPGLSEDRKCRIKENKNLDELNKDSDVLQAMLDFFPEREYLAFQTVMSKVLKLLAQLIKDDTVHISKSERVSPIQTFEAS